MAKRTVTARFPFNGDVYTAEGSSRIRCARGETWGYFDSSGNWLEGPLRYADPTFCRYMGTQWVVEGDPAKYLRVAHWPKKDEAPKKKRSGERKPAKAPTGKRR
jgi:hypothetical protein